MHHMSADSARMLGGPGSRDYAAMYSQMARGSSYNRYNTLLSQSQHYSASAPVTSTSKSAKKRVRFATPLVTHDMETVEFHDYDPRFAMSMEYLPLHGRT
ncbi:hypothetical protein EC988_004229 [Linderina pennispora]|nr:hypothetical protein EC988_004229 [Linderina pennispora]